MNEQIDEERVNTLLVKIGLGICIYSVNIQFIFNIKFIFQSNLCSSLLKLTYHHQCTVTHLSFKFPQTMNPFKRASFRDFFRLCTFPPTVSVIILHYALRYRHIQIFSFLLLFKELPSSQWPLDPLYAILSVLGKKSLERALSGSSGKFFQEWQLSFTN